MNRTKRNIPLVEYNEQNESFSEDFHSEDDYDSDQSSSDESDVDDENDAVEPPTITQGVVWKDVSSDFLPRKLLPQKEDISTSCDEHCSMLDVFLKLFPRSLFVWIADCTNERLTILAEKDQKSVKLTDASEMMIFVGCLLIMSYNRVPHMYMYWSKNKSVRNETIASSMSRDRFMLLHSKLYFNHPVKPKDADKTYYTSEVINCLVYTFNLHRSESTYQSIDEFMVKFQGRSSIKQFIPNKPVKRGVKGFCRADACSGYAYDFFVYQGKDTNTEDTKLGEWVVKRLCSTIRGENVAIVNDRFFTSVNLLATLNYPCVGTIMSNRRSLPDMKQKIQRGQSVAKCTESGLLCYKWQDTKEVIERRWKKCGSFIFPEETVMLLSNCHEHKIGTAERRQKDGVKKAFDCPEAIIFYNSFMSGVDKSDQYSTCYEIDRKSKKWWKRVFYRLLLIAVSNAWIIYKSFKSKPLPLIDYLMPLSEHLIELGLGSAVERKLVAGGGGRPSKRMRPMKNIGHQPVRHTTRRRCSHCSKRKVEVRTYYVCNTCDVGLCVDCFAPYHGCKVL